jgi:hypothetical protein
MTRKIKYYIILVMTVSLKKTDAMFLNWIPVNTFRKTSNFPQLV